MIRTRTRAPADLGFLLDDLRSAGVTPYADFAATLEPPVLNRSRAMERARYLSPDATPSPGAPGGGGHRRCNPLCPACGGSAPRHAATAAAWNEDACDDRKGAQCPRPYDTGAGSAMDSAQRVQGPGERKARAPEPSSRGQAHASLTAHNREPNFGGRRFNGAPRANLPRIVLQRSASLASGH